MKKLIIPALLLSAFSTNAAVVKVNGVIGLDALSYTQDTAEEHSKTSSGLDRMYLNFSAEHGPFLGSMKLNFDINSADWEEDKYAIFEEGFVRYNYEDLFLVTVGQFQNPFNNLHKGLIKPYYEDGGSFHDSELYRPQIWRNDKGNTGFIFTYLNEDLNLRNDLSLFAKSQPEKGQYGVDKTVDFKDQKGLSNKITYDTDDLTVSFSALIYKHDVFFNKTNYAASLYAEKRLEKFDFWAGYQFAKIHESVENYKEGSKTKQNFPYHVLKYTRPVASSDLHILQLGSQYKYSDLVKPFINAELYYQDDRQESVSYNYVYQPAKFKTKTQSLRLETGIVLEPHANVQVAVGATYEMNEAKIKSGSSKGAYSTDFAKDDILKSNVFSAMSTVTLHF